MLSADELKAIPLFASLPLPDLEGLVRGAADLRLSTGEAAVNEGEERALFAVLSGKIEVIKQIDGVTRTLGWRMPGTIFGEVPLALGTPFPSAFRASEPSRVMRLDARSYYSLAAESPEIATKVGALARERIGGLQTIAAEPPKARVVIFGDKYESACASVRGFLARNQVPFEWLTPELPNLARAWPSQQPSADQRPAIRFDDGEVLFHPTLRLLAERLGLQTHAKHDEYDTVIIGAGPAGLAAAVYGASEGLRTIIVERDAPGGQAGTSSRIENYLGFPTGVSGDELSGRALQQAKRLGAEILITRRIESIDPATRNVQLDDGDILKTRSVVLATGVSWRRLSIEGFDRLSGKGVYYGASRSEAAMTHGLNVHLIGAGNSAGQAALYFANFARSVTIIFRGDRLEKSMSQYLIDQISHKPNITALGNSSVAKVYGDTKLTEIDIANSSTKAVQRADSGGLFVFIGADAETQWLPREIVRDDNGYILTGDAVGALKFGPRQRDPFLLETSVPGIFACGDVRRSPVKRVAAAVGEGSMAIAFVHQWLAQNGWQAMG